MGTDFIVYGHGMDTLFLLDPQTGDARNWVEAHLDPEAQRIGNLVAIEHRYTGDIVRAIQDDGLTVKANLQ